jgi:hypothetical protein
MLSRGGHATPFPERRVGEILAVLGATWETMPSRVAMNRFRLLSLLLLAATWAVWSADAPPAGARLVARTIRLEGYVEKAPEGVRPDARWSIDAGEKSLTLQVTRLPILAGPGAPSDVIQALKPYRAAAFKLVGEEKALREIAAARAGSAIELRGVLRLGPARTLLLDTYEID